MAHGITESDQMVSTNALPWHKLGARTDHLMTPDEALKLGPGDWDVIKKPLFVEQAPGVFNQLTDWVATVRSDTGQPLGAVKPNYTPISNREVAEFQAAVLQVLGKKSRLIETAGSLFGGRVIWFLSHIPKDINLGDGGTISAYQVITTSHNATLAVTLKNTPVRVECANTLDMAVKGHGNVFRFKHTQDWKGKVAQAQQALDLSFTYLDAYEAQARNLMRQKLTMKEIHAFTENLFPAVITDDGKVPARAQNKRDAVLALMSGADNLQNVRMTAWGAYNAVAEFADHHSTFRETEGGTRDENRALSILSGQASLLKEHALAYLLASAPAPKIRAVGAFRV